MSLNYRKTHLAKKKESNPGAPDWYLDGKAFETQVANNKEISVAEHLVQYASQRDLSPRMLKRYAVLATFLDEHYPKLIKHFRDQTPYSSIEELIKLHRISEQAAADIARQVISGEMIASDVKACAEQIGGQSAVKAHESTRSEARRATLLLREAVHLEIERKPERYGLKSSFKPFEIPDLRIKPDLAFKNKAGEVVAIEIRYLSVTSSAAAVQQALMKLAWLQTSNIFSHVVLAVNEEAEQLIEDYRDEFEMWTTKKLRVVYI